MQSGVVVGTAHSTIKHASLSGWKLLLVQCYGVDGKPDGEPLIAIDSLGAGVGDHVLFTSDGKATRELAGSETSPLRYSVIGILD
jgi:ethanolamine utilization protein EutN